MAKKWRVAQKRTMGVSVEKGRASGPRSGIEKHFFEDEDEDEGGVNRFLISRGEFHSLSLQFLSAE